MDYATNLHQIGINLGGPTYGAVSSSFSRGLLCSDLSIALAQKPDPIKEVRGDMSVRRIAKSGLDYTGTFSFALDAGMAAVGSVGDILAGLLGTEAITDLTGGKYKHRFTLSASDLPPWFNIWANHLPTPKQLVGCRWESIKISIDSETGFIKCDVSLKGKDESDLATQTLTFSSAPLLTGNMASVLTLGGVAVVNFSTIEITITNNLEGFRPVSNERTISKLFRKAFSIEVSLSGLTFENETERAKWKAVTSSAFNLKLMDANSDYLEFYFPEVFYQSWEDPKISPDDLLRMSAAFIVTGAPANWYIDLRNSYAFSYATGLAP